MKPSLFNICLAAVQVAGIGLAVMPANAKKMNVLGPAVNGKPTVPEVARIRSVSSPARRSNMKANMIETTRGPTRVFVTHHNSDPDQRGIVSSIAGYRFKEGEPVLFTIDGAKKFNLFSANTRAWATKPEDDRGLVKAMKRGRTLKVGDLHPRQYDDRYLFAKRFHQGAGDDR